MDILIIDDDGDDRDLFCETLNDLFPSVNCIVHENGETALKFLQQTPKAPDYIFLDVFMGGMSGKECLLKIKSLEQNRSIPIIMYSGLDDPNQPETYKKLGASDFICKPSTIDALRNVLLSIIK